MNKLLNLEFNNMLENIKKFLKKFNINLNGTKYLITNGSICDAVVVFAYPKGDNKRYDASYEASPQGVLFI